VRLNANGSQECVVCVRRRNRDWQRHRRARDQQGVDDKQPDTPAQPGTVALIVWRPQCHEFRASWIFFHSRADALAAAPTDAVWSVVDTATPTRRYRGITDEQIRRARRYLAVPYPGNVGRSRSRFQ
jgi:hypothetical protein